MTTPGKNHIDDSKTISKEYHKKLTGSAKYYFSG
jgi:hypothetical protein